MIRTKIQNLLRSPCHCEAGEKPAEAIWLGAWEVATHPVGARNDIWQEGRF